jgi:hypothetical protein
VDIWLGFKFFFFFSFACKRRKKKREQCGDMCKCRVRRRSSMTHTNNGTEFDTTVVRSDAMFCLCVHDSKDRKTREKKSKEEKRE